MLRMTVLRRFSVARETRRYIRSPVTEELQREFDELKKQSADIRSFL
jgi:hypothetical protein